ncbi:hypothetical protein AB0B86_28020 [Micromonospora sp. NPDC049047]|uniref:hypothetical protein n=1 Tax=Micromonospora sp. NPDC049047 TaxID=3155645 RepID=UPI0033FAC672
MQPVRYRPSDAALNLLLMISGYLRDLGENESASFLNPGIKNVQVPRDVEKAVVTSRRRIASESQNNTELRLTGRYQAAWRIFEELQAAASTDSTCAALLTEKRQYKFSEVPFVGYHTVTLGEMLQMLAESDYLGNAPCMNFLGGQLQDYISELWALPKPSPAK